MVDYNDLIDAFRRPNIERKALNCISYKNEIAQQRLK